MARVNLEQAKLFNARRGAGALVVASMKYLEMADGNEELAGLIADYYQGTGEEKTYTVGKVIKDFWIEQNRRGTANGW